MNGSAVRYTGRVVILSVVISTITYVISTEGRNLRFLTFVRNDKCEGHWE